MSEKRVHYIDPEVHSQRKSEFRLHAKCYQNNFKLCLNMTGGGGQYHELPGGYALIKHIRLMSGGVELDSCRFANYYMAWKNINHNNEENRNVRKVKAQNELGFHLTNQLFIDSVDSATHNNTSTSSSNGAVVLNLMEVLPILGNILLINTDLIKNLKVIVEYNTDLQLMKKDTTNAGTISEPILIAEEILNEKLISQSSKIPGVSWEAIETDSFILPEGTANTVQKSVQRINGFDNKRVSKIVMMKHLFPVSQNFTGAVSNGYGPYASEVQHQEELNFILNSAPVFPRNITERAEKAMRLHDAWGTVNILPYSNQSSIGNNKNGESIAVGERVGIPFPANSAADPYPSHKVGQLDYSGLALNTFIRQLEIVYQRLPVTDTNAVKRQNNALEFRFFGMVQKVVKFNVNSPPSIAYVSE